MVSESKLGGADHSEEMQARTGRQLKSLRWYEAIYAVLLLFCVLIPQTLFQSIFHKLFGRLQRENKTIRQVASNVWQVTGPNMNTPMLPCNMTVIRLDDGTLALFNVISPTDKTVSELRDLGEVSHIVGLTIFHDSFIRAFSEAFPNAAVVCSRGNVEAFEQCGVTIDMTLDEFVRNDDVLLAVHDLRGIVNSPCGECLLTFHVEEEDYDGIIITDAVQNQPFASSFYTLFPLGWTGLRIANFYKYMVVANREAFRVELLRILSNNHLGLIMFGHGEPLSGYEAASKARDAVKKYGGDAFHF